MRVTGDGRMAGRQLIYTRVICSSVISTRGRMSCETTPLGIPNIDHDPLTVASLQGVLHDHPAVHARIALWMKRYGRVRHILIERNRSCRDIQRIQIETGPGLQAVDDRFLDLFLAFDAVSAAYEQHGQRPKRR